MGASCSHNNTEFLSDAKEVTRFIVWKSVIQTKRCKDCGKLWRKEMVIGRLTGFHYSSSTVDPKTCDHKYYDVNDKNIEVQRESTFGSTILGLIFHSTCTVPYWVAVAKCKRCDFEFLVRANFHTVWRNLSRVEERYTSWKPMKRDVYETKTVGRQEFVPVSIN